MGWLEDFKYRMRTQKPKQMQRLDDNTYYGGNLGGVTITKKRKKPYWISPRGAGNMTVMPGDSEMVFFAPIAAGAGISASPAITSALGSAVSGINTVGDALAATAAGQRLTSGLNFAANAIGSSKAWPWIDAGLTSVFGAHGIDKVRRGDIHNVEDVVETGLDLLPLSQLARPVVNTAGRIAANAELYSATRKPVFSEGYTITTPKVRTRVGDVEIDNPQLAYRQGDKGIVEDFLKSGEVRIPEGDYVQPIIATTKSKNPAKKSFTFDLSRSFENPMFAQGYLWYGVPEKTGSGLLTTAEPLGIATKESRLVKSTSNGTFDLRYPNVGKSGRRVQLEDGQLDPTNTSAYTWIPGYGYKKVTTESPALSWQEAYNYTPAPRGLISRESLIARGGYEVARYPGYQLKGLMGGSPLERQLSKNGTININQLNAYFNKASQLEREVANKVLAEKFAGQRVVDYNQFKKAVQDELIGSYNRVPQTEWADYGMEGLGFETRISHDGNSIAYNEITGEFEQVAPFTPFKPNYTLNTFTFESPRIPYGNTKHYGGNPLGHSRTYTLPEDPHTLYVMESQSDWAQQGLRKKTSIDAQSAYERASQSATKHQQEIEQMKANLEKGLAPDGHKIQYDWERRDIEEIIKQTERQLANNNARAARFDAILHPEKYVQENYLKQNYLQRQLQENLRYAAENGQTRMRYPTPETAAEIEGYQKNVLARTPEEEAEMQNLFKEEMTLRSENPNSPRLKEISDRMNEIGNGTKRIYPSEHQTILRKYADFPKLFQKLYKGHPVRTVTDAKGNTWYEIDVPENYLNTEWQFKKGGQLISRNIITRFKK